MDAITLLKEDHKNVEKLFKRFEKAGSKAYTTKRAIVDSIIEELSVHAVIEEQLFYPVTRDTVPETEDIALESLEAHHIVKWVLNDLDSMSPEDERFDAKVTVLMENVRHHVEEEEEEYFPKVRDELGRKALNDLGDALMAAKKTAPTHPHPTAPGRAPGQHRRRRRLGHRRPRQRHRQWSRLGQRLRRRRPDRHGAAPQEAVRATDGQQDRPEDR